ncbi:MAG TPA: hypothetical protein VM942_08185 [Acidimicrobiales bacterium]|nr:hypothetical protein [Acidimicrobiales bacterium]
MDVVRPDDHVVLSLRFRGVEVEPATGELVRNNDAVVIVEFPPQAFAEEAYNENDTAPFRPEDTPGRIEMRISGRSRVVFAVPPGLGRIEYSLEGILEALSRAAVVTAHQPSGALFPSKPDRDRHTVLEVPYGVLLSPGLSAGWAHTPRPAGHASAPDSFALWHTRLGVRRPSLSGGFLVDEGESGDHTDNGRIARAAFRPPDTLSELFATPFPPGNRVQLFNETHKRGQPPITIDRLMLSSLGAWLDAHWERPAGSANKVGLVSWRHHATMGRDHAVRIVDIGWLYPYGHRVARSSVSQRVIGADGIAYLHQRQRLLVRQPVRTYRDLGMPFRTVRITTTATPALASTTLPQSAVDGDHAFWPMVTATEDFLFDLEVEDRAGTVLRFRAPLIFVSTEANIQTVRQRYLSGPDTSRRVREMGGRRIVWVGDSPSTTSFDTASVALTTEDEPRVNDEPPFKPFLHNAVVSVPALRALTGKERVGFSYHSAYRHPSPEKHPADVFAVINPNDDGKVAFGPDVSGGMLAPNTAVANLSTTLGPIGGGPDIDQGTFSPKTYFGDAAPSLFGIVPLAEVLAGGDLTGGAAFVEVHDPFDLDPNSRVRIPVLPQMVTESPGATRMRWATTNLKRPQDFPASIFVPEAGALLWLDVVRQSGADPMSRTRCHIGPFSLDLSLMEVKFEHFQFVAESGRKADASVRLAGIEFKGPLKFVNELQSILDPEGFVDPPALEVTAEGITAGYTLEVPNLAFGIFNLRNLSVGAKAHLPLVTTGGSVVGVGFQISERHNPFLVSVSYFAGMGFLGISAGLDGVKMLEASLEFGGALAIDIGVASGAVTLTAGLYYAKAADAKDSFSGFIRCTGAVEVLGLICISAQFYLELKFVGEDPPLVRGTATLVVKIEILFFSKEVDLTVTREFSRSPESYFDELIHGLPVWAEYCDAFATEP